MIHQDFLLRQIQQLATAVLKKLQGESVEVAEAVQGVAGIGPDVASALPAPQLIRLLTTADGLDGPRCLAVGLGLVGEPGQADKALALIDAALAARPDLDDPAVQAVREALQSSR